MESKLMDSNLIRKLNTLKLNTNIIMDKGYIGGRKSNSKGSSVEFSDYRQYTPGDDFRKIDWNAYGRFEKLFIKLFMEERQTMVNIFIDTSKSMNFGEPKKSLISKKLALSLGYLSLANMDRVNVYTSNNNLNEMGYIEGKNSVLKLNNYLENITQYENADIFSLIKTKPYKRGISIIISDLFSDNFKEAVKYLSYMKQSIIVLHIMSREELNPEYSGDLKLIDSENLTQKDISMTGQILTNYQNELKHFLAEADDTCRKYRGMYTILSNNISIEEMIFKRLIKEGILR